MVFNKKRGKLLHREDGAIPAYFDLVEHGHLLYNVRDWMSSHSLRYHTCLIPFIYDPKVMLACAFGVRLAVGKKLATESRKKEPNGV